MSPIGGPDSDPARREAVSGEPHRSAALRYIVRSAERDVAPGSNRSCFDSEGVAAPRSLKALALPLRATDWPAIQQRGGRTVRARNGAAEKFPTKPLDWSDASIELHGRIPSLAGWSTGFRWSRQEPRSRGQTPSGRSAGGQCWETRSRAPGSGRFAGSSGSSRGRTFAGRAFTSW